MVRTGPPGALKAARSAPACCEVTTCNRECRTPLEVMEGVVSENSRSCFDHGSPPAAGVHALMVATVEGASRNRTRGYRDPVPWRSRGRALVAHVSQPMPKGKFGVQSLSPVAEGTGKIPRKRNPPKPNVQAIDRTPGPAKMDTASAHHPGEREKYRG